MRHSFFEKDKKVRTVKVALCSNAKGQSSAQTVFPELFSQCTGPWEPRFPWLTHSVEISVVNEMCQQYELKGDALQYGRTSVSALQTPEIIEDKTYVGLAIKVKKPTETVPELRRELTMQSILGSDQRIRSHLPKPLYAISAQDETEATAFLVPEGYYDYLSMIEDPSVFQESACRAAHDLGYLLKQYGLVFPNLISIFHAKDRPYTLLPNETQALNANYGGLPGKIEDVIGQTLYENVGRSGLRDLGDLEHIASYVLKRENTSLVNSMPVKMAHFISLYLMVFTLLMGNRSRMLEQKGCATAWEGNDQLFSAIIRALLEGLEIELSPELLYYIDPAVERDISAGKMQPAEKFNRQLQFCFTSQKDEVFDCPNGDIAFNQVTAAHTRKLAEFYGSQKVSFYCGDAADGMENRSGGMYRTFLYGGTHNLMLWGTWPISIRTAKGDFGGHDGWLGCYSGINPLVSACKYALRVAQVVVMNEYGVAHTPSEEAAASEEAVDGLSIAAPL